MSEDHLTKTTGGGTTGKEKGVVLGTGAEMVFGAALGLLADQLRNRKAEREE